MPIELLEHPFFIIYAVIFLALLYKYLIYPRKILFRSTKKLISVSDQGLGVSVIIAAKNEFDNLSEFLPTILEQDYSNFEVIVVNDQSFDGTYLLLKDFQVKYPHLKIVNIDEEINDFSGKKLALTLGIKAAKHEILLFTDADCLPSSNQWITTMMSGYTSKDIDFVIGFSPYFKTKGLLNFIIRYETLSVGIKYLSSGLNKRPYMGVGRNLSYKKSLFFNVKGFHPYLNIPFGDDDLFVNLHANKSNTNVVFHPNSFIESRPKTNWEDYFYQKQRHQAASKYYRPGSKFRQLMDWSVLVWFYLFPLVLFLDYSPWILIAGLFGLGIVIQMVSTTLLSRKLKEGYIGLSAIFMEPFYTFIYLPVFGLAGLIRGDKKKW